MLFPDPSLRAAQQGFEMLKVICSHGEQSIVESPGGGGGASLFCFQGSALNMGQATILSSPSHTS